MQVVRSWLPEQSVQVRPELVRLGLALRVRTLPVQELERLGPVRFVRVEVVKLRAQPPMRTAQSKPCSARTARTC